jgi:hypothetical protein
MFADIYHLSYRDHEAELYRTAARQHQVRLAVQAAREQAAEQRRDEQRGEGGSQEGPVPPPASRWSLRRTHGAAAVGRC